MRPRTLDGAGTRPIGSLPSSAGLLHQLAAPESREEFRDRKDVDSVLRSTPPRLQAGQDPPADRGVILLEGAKPFEMVARRPRRRLDFDGDSEIVGDEVHLDAAGQPPVVQDAIGAAVRQKGGQFSELLPV